MAVIPDPPWRLPSFWNGDEGDPENWAIKALRAYFAPGTTTAYAYSGARFEELGQGAESDAETLNRVTAADLVALSTLSVPVSGHAAISILETQADDISKYLVAIPPDIDLIDDKAERYIANGEGSDKLWKLLRTNAKFGPTRTSKLLARKRPRLLPIYDSVIADQLGFPNSLDYWRATRNLLLSDGRYVDFLRAVLQKADIGQEIALLRVFDILVWMSVKYRPAQERAEDT